MLVGYGHLLVLIKKQLSDQYRKASHRINLKHRRESYLLNEGSRQLEFPKVSALKLELMKQEIRLKARKDFQKKLWIEGTIFCTLLVTISIWASNYLFV